MIRLRRRRYACVLFAGAVAAPAVYGQPLFRPRVPFEAGSRPGDVLAHDMNGDGLVDLVVSNRISQTVTVHLNHGGGWLARTSAVGAGVDPRIMAAADFDQDGDIDIVVSNFDEAVSTLTFLPNDGAGRLHPGAPIPVIGRPRGVATADFDGDGLSDLVAACAAPSGVAVLLNMGRAQFTAPFWLQAGDVPGSVAAGDLNLDGHIDIVATNRTSNDVTIFYNNGEGLFIDSDTLPAGLAPKSEAIGDINGDGWPDVVVANGNDDTISVYMNDGAGALLAPYFIPASPDPHDILLGDFDGDGTLDIATADVGAHDSVSVHLNPDGDGAFLQAIQHPVGVEPAALTAADFDGDGKLDVATADMAGNSISVLPSVGLRSFIAGKEALQIFFAGIQDRRWDVILIGSEPNLHDSHGWDHGWTRAIADEFQSYATGLVTPNSELSPGDGSEVFGSLGLAFGAPAPLENFLNRQEADLRPLRYAHLSDAESDDSHHGFRIAADSELGIASPLRFHFTFGEFEAGNGQFQPHLTGGETPDAPLIIGPSINPAQGDFELTAAAIDLPSDANRDFPVSFRWAAPGAAVEGPFFGLYMRAENRDRVTGGAVHTLAAQSSGTVRSLAVALNQASDETLMRFFTEATRLQSGPERRLLVRIEAGTYDLEDDAMSVGVDGGNPSNTPEGYLDNVTSVINRLEEIRVSLGMSTDEFLILITLTHEYPAPEENRLLPFRVLTDALADEWPNLSVAHLDLLAPSSMIAASGWYDIQDHRRLTPEGYESLATKELEALLDAAAPVDPLPADINDDGVVNGVDLAMLLSQWGFCANPLGCGGDLTGEGLINGSDLAVLLANWGATLR